MLDYLYNVAQSFMPYLVGGVFVLAMFVAILSIVNVSTEQRARVRRYVFKTVLAIWVLGLLLALVAPANTFKREPHNKAATNAQIEQHQKSLTSNQLIVDRSRKPAMTDEERAAHVRNLVDYRK